MSVAYMSSEESLSETVVSESHEVNSSGSDEDLPNREISVQGHFPGRALRLMV